MDFDAPDKIKLSLDWSSYSSGMSHIELTGDTLGVISALRAIAEGEGLGVPREVRESIEFCDSGSRHGSIYAVASKKLPAKGRKVTREEATRFAVSMLKALGVEIVD